MHLQFTTSPHAARQRHGRQEQVFGGMPVGAQLVHPGDCRRQAPMSAQRGGICGQQRKMGFKNGAETLYEALRNNIDALAPTANPFCE